MKFVTEWLASSQEFFQHLGWLGMVLFAISMTFAGLVALPMSPFAITAGLIFGFGRGLLVVQCGTMLSAAVNFFISRHLARRFVQKKLATHPKFRAIDSAVGREGWKIVALLRFVPLPFGLMNYSLGLTAIPFWPYLLASSGPIILGNSFFVWVGATTHAGLEAASGAGRPHHPMEIALMVLGVLGAFGALTFVTKIARQAIARQDETLTAE
jgi:uncharacterized membrane protein YdjX (TVP38/TMEM64 family)